MGNRKPVPKDIETRVLVQSRRRCCICFGLDRDELRKPGQIAHLNGDRNNNEFDNLAFLCLPHHDEYDGRTSQSKGLTIREVKHYRDELLAHYGNWQVGEWRDQLLSFLGSSIDIEKMADVAVAIPNRTVFNGDDIAYEVLVSSRMDYCDWDLLTPRLELLDHLQSWGWVSYNQREEHDSENAMPRTYIRVEHKPICREVAQVIRARIATDTDRVAWLDMLDKKKS